MTWIELIDELNRQPKELLEEEIILRGDESDPDNDAERFPTILMTPDVYKDWDDDCRLCLFFDKDPLYILTYCL